MTAQADAPMQVKLDPKRVERLEGALAQNGAVGVVTSFYHPTEMGIEGKVWTAVLGQDGPLPLGPWDARLMCSRLNNWNREIGRPRWRTELDEVRRRFYDANSGGSSSSPATPMMVAPPVTADGGVEKLM